MPPRVHGRAPQLRARLSAEAAIRLWGSGWRPLLRRALPRACGACRGSGRLHQAACGYCINGKALVHILGFVKDGCMQIALPEAFYRALDRGMAAVEDSSDQPASRRWRVLFRRGVPLKPSAIWLQRLEEATAMENWTLWMNEATGDSPPS